MENKKSEKMNIPDKIEEGYVRAILIIEVLGRPEDYVTRALQAISDNLEKEREIILLEKKVYKPRQVEKSNLFTSFCEIEVLALGIGRLMELCFDYMPSSIEIIEPNNIKLDIANANSVINDLAARLHRYDEFAKSLTVEKNILKNFLDEKKINYEKIIEEALKKQRYTLDYPIEKSEKKD